MNQVSFTSLMKRRGNSNSAQYKKNCIFRYLFHVLGW